MFDTLSLLPLLLAQLLPAVPATGASQSPAQFDPTFEQPTVVRERGASPVFYRIDPRLVYGFVRSQTGVHVRVAPTAGAAFTFGALGGALVRAGRNARVSLVAETGYRYVGFGSHFVVFGAGLLIDARPRLDDVTERDSDVRARGRVALILHGLAGASESRGARGVRTSLAFAMGWLTVGAGHQWVDAEGLHTHELHLELGTMVTIGER